MKKKNKRCPNRLKRLVRCHHCDQEVEVGNEGQFVAHHWKDKAGRIFERGICIGAFKEAPNVENGSSPTDS